MSIETVKINDSQPGFAELEDFKGDCKRVRADCQRLIELRPDRAESYKTQLASTLALIEKQAIQTMRAAVKKPMPKR